jgi:ammonium transporter Rh
MEEKQEKQRACIFNFENMFLLA